MTSLFGARPRAEQLAALLDAPVPATAGGAPDPGLDRLVGLATALRALPPATPRPQFSASLRERLMSQAAVTLDPTNRALALPPRQRGARERRLAVAAAALVVVGGTAGVATAAQQALPGQALYPVKRGLEHAQTTFATSPAARGQDLLQQASDRLDEVHGLVGSGSAAGAPQVPATLRDFTVEARSGATLLMGSFRDDRDGGSIHTVRRFAADALVRLQQLAPQLPTGAQDELATAATTLQTLDHRAARLCPTCAAGLPALRVPPMLLTSSAVSRALHRAEHTPLDNSHPVVVDPRTITAPPSPTAHPPVTGRSHTAAGAGWTGGAKPAHLPAAHVSAPPPALPSSPASLGKQVRRDGRKVLKDLKDAAGSPGKDLQKKLHHTIGGALGGAGHVLGGSAKDGHAPNVGPLGTVLGSVTGG